jgi:hypothetical protein
MVSPTQHTYSVRRRKKTNQGKRRKRLLRARGSTPKFPLHPEGKPAAKAGK